MEYKLLNNPLNNKIYSRWEYIVNKIIDVSGVIFLSIMLIFIIIQVIMRYIFNSPLTWSEELARFSLIWFTFIGSAIAMRDKCHIDVAVVTDILPDSVRNKVLLLSRLITSLFLILLVYYGFGLVIMNLATTSPVTGVVMGWVYLCVPLYSAIMLAYLLINLLTKRKE